MTWILTIGGFFAVFAAGHAQAAPVAASEQDIAQCVVDNDMRHVAMLLRSMPGSGDEQRATRALVELYGACNDNAAATGRFAWRERAELAQAAVLDRIARGAPDVVAGVARDGWALELGNGIKPASFDAAAAGTRQFGDCVVRAAPDASLRLVRADPGSQAESVAIAALTPALAPCMIRGQNLRLKRQDLRLIVAEPLYHVIAR